MRRATLLSDRDCLDHAGPVSAPPPAAWESGVDPGFLTGAYLGNLFMEHWDTDTALLAGSLFHPGFDLALAAKEAGEGRYFDATTSLIGVVPVVGDLTKGGLRVARHGDKSVAALRTAFRKGYWATRTWIEGVDVHHLFPVALESRFWERWGIDIWDYDQFAAVWERGAHQQSSAAYQAAWQEWLDDPANMNATLEQVLAQAAELAKRFNFTWP